jgi:hypothetical protein
MNENAKLHNFKLTAKITLDSRFQQTGIFQEETAEAIRIIIEPKIERLNRGLLLKISDVKVEWE